MPQEFQDRTGSNLNRRILKIVKREGDEITVDIKRADNPTQEGTRINAETFNNWERRIVDVETDSSNALTNANAAVKTANSADSKSDNAVATANQAKTESANAKSTVDEIKRQVDSLTESVDISQINGSGTPTVELIDNSDGTKKFSFKNLKGAKGDKGGQVLEK